LKRLEQTRRRENQLKKQTEVMEKIKLEETEDQNHIRLQRNRERSRNRGKGKVGYRKR
jgi:hypothetical protein